MSRRRAFVIHGAVLGAWLAAAAVPAGGQTPAPQSGSTQIHEHVSVPAAMLTPTRDGSGTSWLPVDTPMFGVHRPWRGWDLRLDGSMAGQLLIEPGDRHRTGGPGDRQFSVANWGMVSVRRAAGRGRIGARVMVSAEPLAIPGCGSPSFLATGDVCDDDTVHDRQQPHDAVMELAVDYEGPLQGHWRWQVYGGLAGEPALGPPPASHRPSGVANPIGPVTHHWLESTSTAFGVVTAGVHDTRWKLEASLFNGGEPDEHRGDLDLGGLDSVAGRVSWLASDALALQVSVGRVRSAPLAFLQPSDSHVIRTTASLVHHRQKGAGHLWATTLALGAASSREPVSGEVLDTTTFAALLETSLDVSGRDTVFGRAELMQMPAHHLHAAEFFTDVFGVAKLQVGYIRRLRTGRRIVPGIGATVAFSLVPPELAPRYSGRVAPSVGLFLSLRPPPHRM